MVKERKLPAGTQFFQQYEVTGSNYSFFLFVKNAQCLSRFLRKVPENTVVTFNRYDYKRPRKDFDKVMIGVYVYKLSENYQKYLRYTKKEKEKAIKQL